MNKDKLIEEMLKGMGDRNNTIDLNAYGRGLIDMCDRVVNSSNAIPDVSFSLRDKFAMMAISGLTSATEQDGTWTGNDPETVADEAYKIADAMIKARSNES